MRRAISVGKGFRKHSLQEAIKMAGAGDAIVFDAGDYEYPNGISISKGIDIIFRGNGDTAADVNLASYIVAKENSNVHIENMTITAGDSHNAVYAVGGSSVTMQNVAVKSESTKYPAVYIDGATVNASACEFRDQHLGAVNVMNQAEFSCDSSVVENLFISKATSHVNNSELSGYIAVVGEDAELHLDDAYIKNENSYANHDYLLAAYGGGQVFANSLHFEDPFSHLWVNHGYMQFTNPQIGTSQTIEATSDEYSTIEGDADRIKITYPQAQTASSNSDENQTSEDSNDDNSEDTTETDTQTDDERQENQTEEQSALTELQNMIGLESVKETAKKFISLATYNKQREADGLPQLDQSLHSLFLGNPGTGKTTVARLLAKALFEEGVIAEDKLVEVSRQDLVSQNVGGTAIQTKQKLEEATGGVLFVDEAYTLYQDGSMNWGQEALDTILKYMEDHRDDLMIIFAGYTDEMKKFLSMNEGLASRVPNTFDFEDYSDDEIAQIGSLQLHAKKFEFNEQLYHDVVVQAYNLTNDSSNGRWVRNFNEKLMRDVALYVIENHIQDTNAIPDELLTTMIGGSAEEKSNNVDQIVAELDAMIGLKSVKDFVHNLVKQVQADKALGESSFGAGNYHMVFEGEPGTGKTTVARIIAKIFYNLGILEKDTVKEVDRTDLVGAYIGHTEKNTKEVIENSLGGVLFVDEAYQLSSGGENDFGKQAIETMITELENHRGEFVAIFAGYTDDMEKFLQANSGLRSRVPLKIEFDSYTPEEIAQIVSLQLTHAKWTFNEGLLTGTVKSIYGRLPQEEQSNGRWARNYVEKLVRAQKVWIVEKQPEDMRDIPDDVVLDNALEYRQ